MTEGGLTCDLCSFARANGWWGRSGITHCKGCHRTWGQATREAHCTRCHAHFTTPRNFDLHLTPSACRPPGEVRDREGEARLVQRDDGVWIGPPDPTRPAGGRLETKSRG